VRLNIASMSGGKDSTATALVMRETEPESSLRYVFADTGNEHEITYQYLDYLERFFGPIKRLRADFTDWWWRRRDYVRDVYPTKLVEKEGYSVSDADAIVLRCLSVLEKGPTKNPYLDLCIIKGRFPSRRAQFCTEELKTKPMVEYQLSLIDSGEACAIWSWQGVRADESGSRAHLRGTGACVKGFEVVGGGIYTVRPIIRWRAADTFEAMTAAGIEPNPLYKLGMSRVGCMPCINAAKLEVREIAKRFPEHIDRIEEWELAVQMASKRGGASFFPAPTGDDRGMQRGNTIRAYVQWSKTSRGWRTEDLFANEEPKACSSAYGLCE